VSRPVDVIIRPVNIAVKANQPDAARSICVSRLEMAIIIIIIIIIIQDF